MFLIVILNKVIIKKYRYTVAMLYINLILKTTIHYAVA